MERALPHGTVSGSQPFLVGLPTSPDLSMGLSQGPAFPVEPSQGPGPPCFLTRPEVQPSSVTGLRV